MPLKFTVPLWLTLCGLLGLAWNLGDPLLSGLRAGLGPLLIGIGIAGGVSAGRLAPDPGRRLALSLGFALLALLSAWPAVTAAMDRRVVDGATADEAATLGPHFIVGYSRFDDVRPLIERGLVGGLYVTRRNIERTGANGLKRELAALQQIRQAHGLPPLVIAADQEGGPVSHLSPPLTAMPGLSTLALLPANQRQAAARAFGLKQGKELTAIGVTMDLSPVVDLKPDGPPAVLNLHTRIDARAISDDPAVVAEIGRAYAQGLQEAGILPTLKHFPGLGRVPTDTHLFGASLDASTSELDVRDWRPFKSILDGTGAALMIGHVTLTAVDPARPASQSRAVAQGLIRDGWGHRGLIITDDLTMGAVYRSGLCNAVSGGLDGGVDLLLVSWDTDRIYPALRCGLEALRRGRLDPRMLQASAARLATARASSAGEKTP